MFWLKSYLNDFTSVKHDYYLETNDKKVVALPTSKTKLLLMYPQQESDIKKFLKDNNISLSKENDIFALAQFLSTLQ